MRRRGHMFWGPMLLSSCNKPRDYLIRTPPHPQKLNRSCYFEADCWSCMSIDRISLPFVSGLVDNRQLLHFINGFGESIGNCQFLNRTKHRVASRHQHRFHPPVQGVDWANPHPTPKTYESKLIHYDFEKFGKQIRGTRPFFRPRFCHKK